MIVSVLYTEFTSKLDINIFNNLLKSIPTNLVTSILRFNKWEDRHAALFGKLLLQKGLYNVGFNRLVLEQLKYSSFSRPYIDCCPDFNISHTKNGVVCAIGHGTRVGIDLEKHCRVGIEDFKQHFQSDEWYEIQRAECQQSEFLKFWTRKEAVLKGDGRGLNVPLEKLNVIHNAIELDNETWFLHNLSLIDGYVAHLATNKPISLKKILITKVHFI